MRGKGGDKHSLENRVDKSLDGLIQATWGGTNTQMAKAAVRVTTETRNLKHPNGSGAPCGSDLLGTRMVAQTQRQGLGFRSW